MFNEKANELKQELNNLRNEVSDLEDNKKSISKEIINLNKDKEDITDEIDKKKKLNNKIIIKSKNQLLDDNKKLQTIFYKGIMPSEKGFRFSSGL